MNDEPRLQSLELVGFRGAPHHVRLDFTQSSNTARSAIILGDNGTGKSSIVDAIEFGLQARYVPSRRPLASYSSATPPQVRISFSDGAEVTRRLELEEGEWEPTDFRPHPRFRISPMVLRRSDLLRFIDTPEAEGQVLFMDYFKGVPAARGHEWEQMPEKLERLKNERIEAKAKRRDVIGRLASLLGTKVEEIPLERGAFDAFIRTRVNAGVGSREKYFARKKGIEIRVETDSSILDCVAETRRLLDEVNRVNRELKAVKRRPAVHPRKQAVETFLAKVDTRLTTAFKEISPSNFVRRLELRFGELSDVSLSVKVHLENGAVVSPRHIFSEANLDLVALLIFLSVAKEAAENGQAQILALDDVLQSVDSTIRVAVMNYVLREFAAWQLFITVHDRLWHRQLRDIFSKANHQFVEFEILRWSFATGPVIQNAHRDLEDVLRGALDRGEAISIAAHAGLAIELLCNTLSWSLPVSIIRKRGDRYTLGDLWPPIGEKLEKSTAHPEFLRVQRFLHLRNLIGAHYNEWAASLPLSDATEFGESVLALMAKTKCGKCNEWIRSSKGRQGWSCPCGHTNISPSL